jgi:hypothetical protein
MSASKKPLEVDVGDDKVVKIRLRVPASLHQRLYQHWHKRSLESPDRTLTFAALMREFLEESLVKRGG